MDITKTTNGSTLEIKIAGRLESLTAPQLDAEIKGLPAEIKELIMDISEMEYTSSAGLRVFLSAHKLLKSRGGAMKVRGVTPSVKKLFDLTAFTPILNFID